MTAEPQKVLYIGGFGRSGSTLVERILGQLPGFCSSGEVVFIWQRGLIDGQLCGCGVPVPECEFWSRVGKTAFGGWDQIDAHEMLALQKRVDRNRYIPSMVAPKLRPAAQADLDRYTDVLSKLYRAIGEVAGARVVIDASKHASTAFLLRRVPGIDLRVVHLVRDSRGVAYSWTKEVKKPEVTGDDAFMPQYSPSSSGRQWVAYNLMFDALGLLDARGFGGTPRKASMLLRYEALMAEPRQGLERILAHVDEPVTAGSFDFLGDGWVDLGCDHTVAGNPMRFHQGRLDLRLDQAWTTKLPERDRKVVTAITWPLQLRYGYSKRNAK
jgi:Sulfotransferase family